MQASVFVTIDDGVEVDAAQTLDGGHELRLSDKHDPFGVVIHVQGDPEQLERIAAAIQRMTRSEAVEMAA